MLVVVVAAVVVVVVVVWQHDNHSTVGITASQWDDLITYTAQIHP